MSGFYEANQVGKSAAVGAPMFTQTPQRPPVPTAPPAGYAPGASPYGAYQVTPGQLWSSIRTDDVPMGYQAEPTMVEVVRDLVKASNDSARFAVGGGFVALSQIVQETIDFRLTQFFTNFRIEIHQVEGGSGAMFLKPAAEQPTEEGKRLQTLTNSDLSAKIEEIKSAINDNLLAGADSTISLHAQAAALATQQGIVGGLLQEAATNGRGGIVSGAASVVGGVLRSAAGLPPAPKPPGA